MLTSRDEILETLEFDFIIDGPATVSNEGVVDVKGNVSYDKSRIRIPFQFGVVTGNFSLDTQMLISLEGAPHYVGGNFSCSHNRLTSLAHAPTHVGGFFSCNHNRLENLTGAPAYANNNFWCVNNNLTSLQGAPKFVKGDFICSHNKLTNLEGAPQTVGSDFMCNMNPSLVSLQGAPDHVNGEFVLTYYDQLPLLRLINYRHLLINQAPAQVTEIMRNYQGQGKKAALACAAELIRAGYKDNAKW